MFPLGIIAAMGRSAVVGFFMDEGGLDFFGAKDIGSAVVGSRMPLAQHITRVFIPLMVLFLNSGMRSLAHRLVAGSHESWALLYPFHWTLYCCSFLHPKSLASNTCLTSHSSSLSTSSGGSCVKFGPCSSISLYGDSRPAWNTLWIFQFFGRSSWYATCEMTFMMVKGPCHLACNLMAGWLVFKFSSLARLCHQSYMHEIS